MSSSSVLSTASPPSGPQQHLVSDRENSTSQRTPLTTSPSRQCRETASSTASPPSSTDEPLPQLSHRQPSFSVTEPAAVETSRRSDVEVMQRGNVQDLGPAEHTAQQPADVVDSFVNNQQLSASFAQGRHTLRCRILLARCNAKRAIFAVAKCVRPSVTTQNCIKTVTELSH